MEKAEKVVSEFSNALNGESGYINIRIKVEDEDLDSILCGALEGGSNYWCAGIKVVNNDYKGAEFASEAVSKGAKLDVYLSDDYGQTNEAHRLTKAKLLKGCELYCSGDKNTNGRRWDPCGMDAIDYDMIFQYALFGEVVYG